MDTIAGLAFGTDINTLESDDDIIQHHLDKILPALYRRSLSMLPYWRWFKLAADRRAGPQRGGSRGGHARPSRSRRASACARPRAARAPAQPAGSDDRGRRRRGSGIDDPQVAGNVLTMLLAGEDTTANTLAWLMHLLHRNPHAWRGRATKCGACARRAGFTPEHMASLD